MKFCIPHQRPQRGGGTAELSSRKSMPKANAGYAVERGQGGNCDYFSSFTEFSGSRPLRFPCLFLYFSHPLPRLFTPRTAIFFLGVALLMREHSRLSPHGNGVRVVIVTIFRHLLNFLIPDRSAFLAFSCISRIRCPDFYAKNGDIFSWGCLAYAGALAVVAARKKRKVR